MKKNTVRVLMVGGRRCGKSTTLAGMINKANETLSNTMLTFANEDDNVTFAFSNKITKLKDEYFLKDRNSFKPVVLSKIGTNGIEKYPLDLNLAGTNQALKIEFIDIPGEYYKPHYGANTDEVYERRKQEMEEYRATASVFLIAVDTPFLMENKSEATGYGEYHKVNCPGEIAEYLKGLDLTDNEKRKFIFVPLKCEKYFAGENRPNRMPEVVETIKRGYSDLLSYLKSPGIKDLCEVVVAPVISLGGITFSKFIDNQLEPDSSAEYVYTNGPDSKYEPKYCEQPLILLLNFLLERAMENTSIVNSPKKKGFFSKLKEWLEQKWPLWFKSKNGVEIDLSNEFAKEVYKLRELEVHDESNGFVTIQ